MDHLFSAVSAACQEAMQDLKDEVKDLKSQHQSATDVFHNRIGELAGLLCQQAKQIRTLEVENTELRAAQRSQNAHCASHSPETLREELDQLKHASHSTQQSMQSQVKELKAAQARQSSVIEALQIRPQPDAVPRRELVDLLEGLRGEIVERMRAVEAEIASLLQNSNRKASRIAQLEAAIEDCVTEHDLRNNYDIETNRNAVHAMQTAQREHILELREVAKKVDDLKQYAEELQDHGTDLRHDVNTLKQDSADRNFRIYNLEGERSAVVRAQVQHENTKERLNAAFFALRGDVVSLRDRVEDSETRMTELKEDLQSVTNMLLDVVKMARAADEINEQARTMRSATLSELQDRIEDSLPLVHQERVANTDQATDQSDHQQTPTPVEEPQNEKSPFQLHGSHCAGCGRTESVKSKKTSEGVRLLCDVCRDRRSETSPSHKETHAADPHFKSGASTSDDTKFSIDEASSSASTSKRKRIKAAMQAQTVARDLESDSSSKDKKKRRVGKVKAAQLECNNTKETTEVGEGQGAAPAPGDDPRADQ